MKKKCLCKEILYADFGSSRNIYIHLSGCPETVDVKEYDKLKWYKKLFRYNPNKMYNEHLKVLVAPSHLTKE